MMTKYYIQWITSIFICLQSTNCLSVTPLIKVGKNTVTVIAELPYSIKTVEFRIFSERNLRISDIRQVSPYHPQREDELKKQASFTSNIFYPVVDIQPNHQLGGVLIFNLTTPIEAVINGPANREFSIISNGTFTMNPGLLVPWENSVFISRDSVSLTGFYLKSRQPNVTGRVSFNFEPLSHYWRGKVEIWDVTGDREKKVCETDVIKDAKLENTMPVSSDLSIENLKKLVKLCVDFTLRSQLNLQGHPFDGGLFMFYDLDAQTWRSHHWNWGVGPNVSLLLEASGLEFFKDSRLEMINAAQRIGDCTTRIILNEPGHFLNDISITRWDRDLRYHDGYSPAITIADALFLAGWAWIPLFEHTGDSTYYEKSVHLCNVADNLLHEFDIIPHSFYLNGNEWSNWVIDETGFGTEVLDDLFRLTHDTFFVHLNDIWMDRHREIFERTDGLWDRLLNTETGNLVPSKHMIRGLGWAMEGLIAAHKTNPEKDYLNAAIKMADKVMGMQLENGAWSFLGTKEPEEVGYSDKGIPLWSYLLYDLYMLTCEDKFIEAADKALIWCMENLYYGPDPEAWGSIIGRSRQSGVGYRSWYDVSCTYGMGFLGLAALKRIKIMEFEENK